MDLELNRVDYCFVGTTLRNSMKLLPTSYKQQQQVVTPLSRILYMEHLNFLLIVFQFKVVVGDQDGVLQVFSIKKEDTQIHFKTLPTDKITTIQMGGVTGPGIPTKIYNFQFLKYTLFFSRNCS